MAETFTHQGTTQSVFAWARQLGIDPKLVWQRRKRNGWSIEQALFTPPADRLQPVNVLVIRNRLRRGISVQQLAQEYGLGCRALYDLRSGKSWKHV